VRWKCRAAFDVVYGARLRVQSGEHVTHGQILAEWDPFTFSILTETAGDVKFDDLRPGLTIEEQVDEVTGLSQDVVTLPPGDEKHQPAILVRDSSGKVRKKYLMPSRAHLMVQGRRRGPGRRRARKDSSRNTKTKDITGGLPRVVELFETPQTQGPAVISEIDGNVRYGDIAKGMRKVYVRARMARPPRNIPSRAACTSTFRKATTSKPAKPSLNGPLNLHDLLAVLGEKFTQSYLVNAIQEVYRLQGVNINDKHIETISRQMMRWSKSKTSVTLRSSSRSRWTSSDFREENDQVIKGRRPPCNGPSAAPRYHQGVALDRLVHFRRKLPGDHARPHGSRGRRKVDYLRGLKENVIMGRLIPADGPRALTAAFSC